MKKKKLSKLLQSAQKQVTDIGLEWTEQEVNHKRQVHYLEQQLNQAKTKARRDATVSEKPKAFTEEIKDIMAWDEYDSNIYWDSFSKVMLIRFTGGIDEAQALCMEWVKIDDVMHRVHTLMSRFLWLGDLVYLVGFTEMDKGASYATTPIASGVILHQDGIHTFLKYTKGK